MILPDSTTSSFYGHGSDRRDHVDAITSVDNGPWDSAAGSHSSQEITTESLRNYSRPLSKSTDDKTPYKVSPPSSRYPSGADKGGNTAYVTQVEVLPSPSPIPQEAGGQYFGQASKQEDTSVSLSEKPVPSANAKSLSPPKKRVDYLAGLVAVSCLLVTGIHFCLTFATAAINPGAYFHYESELWARRTINSYFLNLIWIGK